MMLETTLTVGIIVVVVSMLVAVIIRTMVAVLGRASGATPRPATPSVTTPVAPAAPGPVTAGGHDPAHVAAITAAVATAFDDSAVVVHIAPARGAAGWTSEARAAHHGSHNVERRSR